MGEKMDPTTQFSLEREEIRKALGASRDGAQLARSWMNFAQEKKYSYQFDWLGRPIIQYPQDIVAMQELIWSVKPDLIIETGIAHGGSLIFSASMLALLDLTDAIEAGESSLLLHTSKRKVIGIDIDIRVHNRAAIEAHPLRNRIQMLQGSSISQETIDKVKNIASGYHRIMVCLDSNHTHKHVLAELNAYAPLTSIGSYCVVFDTVVENMPTELFLDRPWEPGNSPRTAVTEYISTHPEFEVDKALDEKLQISVAPEGFLKRIA